MSGVIRWEEPPPQNPGVRGETRMPWSLIAQQLRERPGEWGVVHEGDSPALHMTHRIAQGKSPWFRPAGHFEATTRIRLGHAVVYARYVGEPPP